jgi:hypothetical protein
VFDLLFQGIQKVTFEHMLASALFPAAYQIQNPKTTPEDVKFIRSAITQMPEAPPLVRINERPRIRSGVQTEAYVDPRHYEVQVVRNAPRFQSNDATGLAALLIHEQAHSKGADEIAAREQEIAFLQKAIAEGYKNHKLMKMLQGNLDQLKKGEGDIATHYKNQK